MLNIKHQFIIYIDHKSFIGFFNTKYYKDIFTYEINKLCLLSICIQYILSKKNIIIDSLFQIIFNNTNYFPNWLVHRLVKEVF